MSDSAKEVVKRGIELFNRDFGAGKREVEDDVRALWAPEPVLVPIRAALEGTEYRGPAALDEFLAASMESWTRLRLEPEEIREIDAERVLMIGDLVGWARETGLETRARVGMLFAVRDGRIEEARTYPRVRDALAAVGA